MHPNEYVFRFDKSMTSKYFKLACDDKGIVDLRLHDPRHEATSVLFEDRWDIPAVAAITGQRLVQLKALYELAPGSGREEGASNESIARRC